MNREYDAPPGSAGSPGSAGRPDGHRDGTGAASADAGWASRGSVSDHLSNERTFLAWIRTSIAIVTLGFVIAKFSVWLRQFFVTVAAATGVAPTALPPPGASLPMGLVLIALGAVTAAAALRRHRNMDQAIARGDFRPTHGLSGLVAVTVVIVALVLITYLYLTSVRL